MAYRFNPAPGWPPIPEGWTPAPGWQPDPSWPPAPEGWQFWVEETPSDTQQGPATPAQDAADLPPPPPPAAEAPPPAAPPQPEVSEQPILDTGPPPPPAMGPPPPPPAEQTEQTQVLGPPPVPAHAQAPQQTMHGQAPTQPHATYASAPPRQPPPPEMSPQGQPSEPNRKNPLRFLIPVVIVLVLALIGAGLVIAGVFDKDETLPAAEPTVMAEPSAEPTEETPELAPDPMPEPMEDQQTTPGEGAAGSNGAAGGAEFCELNADMMERTLATNTAATVGEFNEAMTDVYALMVRVDPPREIADEWNLTVETTKELIDHMGTLDQGSASEAAQEEFFSERADQIEELEMAAHALDDYLHAACL